ncbi:MAG: dihydropteroate synthase [Nitrospirota bacterium]|nr:dihydropteroate synthase [Nitrospirota bacterium]
MLFIAENLNTRNTRFTNALKDFSSGTIQHLASELVDAGANALNIQTSTDGVGDEVALPKVVQAISRTLDVQLVLDSRNVEALARAIPLCTVPPIINYLAAGTESSDAIITLCQRHGCSLILRAMRDDIIPTSLDDRLQAIETLIEKANAAGIVNSRLLADPSIVHMGQGMGQDYVRIYREFVNALGELTDPPVGTIAWISNLSTGLSHDIRPTINATFLAYLMGAGLKAAMVDMLEPEIANTIYLLRVFNNELVFSAAEFERIRLVTV